MTQYSKEKKEIFLSNIPVIQYQQTRVKSALFINSIASLVMSRPITIRMTFFPPKIVYNPLLVPQESSQKIYLQLSIVGEVKGF